MRPEKFIDFLNSPEKLNTATASHFRKLATQYPYCQPLRFVLAKNLQILKSSDYETHVNQAAAMACDRRMFQSYIAGRLPERTKDKAERSRASSKKNTFWPWIFGLLDNKKQSLDKVKETQEEPEVEPSTVTAQSEQPVSRPEAVAIDGELTSAAQPKKKNYDHLINRFIAENPRIGAYNPDIPSDNLAEKNQMQPEEIGTETLAAIYERQGFKGKAIAVYEKLSLKYPEKSSYFAQKISSLKNN